MERKYLPEGYGWMIGLGHVQGLGRSDMNSMKR